MTARRESHKNETSRLHTHPESWADTMDWLDLKNHLINLHGAGEDAVNDLTPFLDGVTGRRRHAEGLHLNAHGDSIRAQPPTAMQSPPTSAPCEPQG
jgi:hypothetical protein